MNPLEELNEHLYRYEEQNLKIYAGTAMLEKYQLFKHPLKNHVKERLDNLPSTLQKPIRTLKLWVKYEQLDILAILEAIEIRHQLQQKRASHVQKNLDYQAELEKLNQGKTSLKTLFSTKDGKVSRITELTRKIAESQKEVECLDAYLRLVILQISQAMIPYFQKDKALLYNDLLNTLARQNLANAQTTAQCYELILKENHVLGEEQPQIMTKSIHQLD